MKKYDLILIIGVVVVATIFYLGYRYFMPMGEVVVVYQDSEEFGRYSLNEEKVIDIDGSNYLEISKGQAKMIEADCPDGLCMNQNSISKMKETIVCLPNEVVVEVISGESAEYDAIAK